jgi:hypothetical protein
MPFFMQKLDFGRGRVMRKPNEINGGRGVRISKNTVFDLEGRCSIHLSYGRSQRDISGWLASAQVRLSHGGGGSGGFPNWAGRLTSPLCSLVSGRVLIPVAPVSDPAQNTSSSKYAGSETGAPFAQPFAGMLSKNTLFPAFVMGEFR